MVRKYTYDRTNNIIPTSIMCPSCLGSDQVEYQVIKYVYIFCFNGCKTKRYFIPVVNPKKPTKPEQIKIWNAILKEKQIKLQNDHTIRNIVDRYHNFSASEIQNIITHTSRKEPPSIEYVDHIVQSNVIA